MVTNSQELKEKELLHAIDIRTMKKDLQKLRESDSLKEREKIGKIKTAVPKIPVPEKVESFSQDNQKSPGKMEEIKTPERVAMPKIEEKKTAPAPIPTPPNTTGSMMNKPVQNIIAKEQTTAPQKTSPSEDKLLDESQYQFETAFPDISSKNNNPPNSTQQELEKIFQQNTTKEQAIKLKIKDYATEAERQQIFLLESQKVNLENQLKVKSKKMEVPMTLEKNKILIEQKNWQKKLSHTIQEEEKIEAEEKTIEAEEKASNVPAEKHKLEEKRWKLEEHKQAIEKKRWSVEETLVKLENSIKKLDENYQKSHATENALKSQIRDIDNSLKIMYSDIARREGTKRKGLAEESLRKIQTDNDAQRQNNIRLEGTKEREYLKEIPLVAKEKLAKSTEVEEKQRIKFIEDVEKWAAEKKDLPAQADDTNQNPNE